MSLQNLIHESGKAQEASQRPITSHGGRNFHNPYKIALYIDKYKNQSEDYAKSIKMKHNLQFKNKSEKERFEKNFQELSLLKRQILDHPEKNANLAIAVCISSFPFFHFIFIMI
jgi:predicted metallo-beta-lactamase superfamily hydrolase